MGYNIESNLLDELMTFSIITKNNLLTKNMFVWAPYF